MEYYAGLDLHKSMSVITLKNESGKMLRQSKVINQPDALRQFFEPWKTEAIHVAMEATSNYQWMYDTLEALGHRVSLAHPLKVRAIASARIKTDKIDSGVLSDLLRADLLPASYVPPHPIRVLRETLRHRIRLVRIRAQIKTRIRCVLLKANQDVSCSNIGSKKARALLQNLALPSELRWQLDDLLVHLDFLALRIQKADQKLSSLADEFPEANKLTSIPGIGVFAALVIVSEIGDIQRFGSWKKLCSYAGLVPGVYQSADTRFGRSITRQGSAYLRWLLVEAAHNLVRSPGPLRSFYLRLSTTKGKAKAGVAVARKILIGIYFMLKENKDFSPKGAMLED